MAVSYKKLFKILIDRDMKKKDLCELAGVSPATITKLSNGENVTMEVIDKICTNLNCSANDILEIIPNCPDNGTDSDVK
jgi:DNA-binding Xre family transcriptional regulator